MKYTAVFEFEEEPIINRADSWLAGSLNTVAFYDVIEELDRLQAKIGLIQEWRDSDGTIEELDKIL